MHPYQCTQYYGCTEESVNEISCMNFTIPSKYYTAKNEE